MTDVIVFTKNVVDNDENDDGRLLLFSFQTNKKKWDYLKLYEWEKKMTHKYTTNKIDCSIVICHIQISINIRWKFNSIQFWFNFSYSIQSNTLFFQSILCRLITDDDNDNDYYYFNNDGQNERRKKNRKNLIKHTVSSKVFIISFGVCIWI